MSRYQVSFIARSDIRETIRYIAVNRPMAAIGLRKKFEAAFAELADHPGIGHSRLDLSNDQDLRFWRVDLYLIVYRHRAGQTLEIIRVLHGRRDIASLLDDQRAAGD